MKNSIITIRNNFYTFAIVSVMALCSMTAVSQAAEPDGFRGIKWGTPLSELESKMVKSENRIPPYDGYDMKNEDLNYLGVTARLITYGFKKGKLMAVNIGIYKKDLEKIVSVYTKQYGEPKKIDTFIFKNYEWHLKIVDIGITSLPGKANTTIGISKKE